MTEELGAISVGLKVGMGTLDADLRSIKKKIEPIEREHKIPFAVGKVSFEQVQKEIAALTRKQIPVQLSAAPGSGRAIHQQLTAQLKAAGPIPVRIKANLSVTEVQRIRTEISKALSKQPIPLRVTVAGGGGSPAVAAPPPAAGRSRPQAPVVASAPAVAAPPAPARRTAATTPSPTPAASPSAAVPTPAQPTPPPAARASTRARKAVDPVAETAAILREQDDAKTVAKAKAAREGRRTVAATPSTPVGPTPPTRKYTRPPSTLGRRVEVRPASEGENVRDLNDPHQLIDLPRTREGRRQLRRADPYRYEEAVKARIQKEQERLTELRSKRLKATDDAEKRRLSDAVRKQRGVVQRVQRWMPGTAEQMTPQEQEEARERYEAREAFRARGMAPMSPFRTYGKLDDVHPTLRRQLEANQMGDIAPILGDAYDALMRGDLEGTRAILRGEGLQFKGASGTRKRRSFAKMFRNPNKVTAQMLLQNAGLNSLYEEVKKAIDPNAVNVPSDSTLRFGSGSRKKAGSSGPEVSEADRDLQAANRGEMSFEELQRRHPEFATLGLPATPWEPKTTLTKAVRRRRPPKYGTIQRTKTGKTRIIKPKEQPLGGYKTDQWQGGPIEGYPEPGRIWVPPPVDLGAEDKIRVENALADAIKDAIEGSTPASKGQLNKLARKYKKYETGGKLRNFTSMAAVRGLMRNEPLYMRWSPDIRADMRPGARSRTLFEDDRTGRKIEEPGISATLLHGGPGHGIDRQYDLSGKSGGWDHRSGQERFFRKRRAYLLRGKPVGVGFDGEDTLDPESIRPIGTLSGRLIDRAIREWLDAGAPPPPERDLGEGHREKYGYEAGGPLMRRIREAAERKAAADRVLVGEKRPEVYVSNRGEAQIVGEKGPEIRSFPEGGEIIPSIPEWRRRMRAKDMTGYETGGRKAKDPAYKGQLAAEPGSGLAGRKKFRDAFSGERESIAAGLLSPQGGVQRVFVTNWPAGVAGRGRGPLVNDPLGYGVAAGPFRGGRTVIDEILRDLGRKSKRALKDTAEKEEKEEKAEKAKPAKLSAEEKVDALLEARYGVDPRGLRDRASQRRAALSETTAYSPVRSIAPAIGQVVGTLTGRGELLKRLAAAREASSLADQATSTYIAERKKLITLEEQAAKTEDPEEKKKLAEAIDDQAVATNKAHSAAKNFNDEADKAAKHADALSLKIGTLVGNTAGIIGGTLLFGGTLAVAQAGLGALAQIATPAIERLTGFTATSAAVTEALGKQIKAQNGAAESAFAMTAADARLSRSQASMIGPLVQQRAATEENNRSLQQGIDLLHTYEEAQRRGGDQGLYGTTSGLFGSIINGVASTQELIKKELNDATAGTVGLERVRGIGKNPFGETYANAEIQPGYRSAAVLAARAAKAKGLSEVEVQTAPFGKGTFKVDDILGGFSVLEGRIKFFNEALKTGGSNLQFVAGASEEVANKFAAAAAEAGATELADTATGPNKVILVDPRTNAPVTDPNAIRGAVGAVNQSVSTPDPDLLIKQLTERIIPAQRALFRAQAGFQRNVLGPGQFALGELAAPTPGTQNVPFEQGLVGTDALTGKVDRVAQKSADKYKKLVGGAVEFVNAEIEKGQQAMIDLVPTDQRSAFKGLLSDISQLGKQISSIQLGVQQAQVNLQVAEYNNQLRIARRSLADARDLQAGLNGETRNTLGGMEAQNILLQRQLQLLQFELQQRQINFRLATAGFVTPGSTPEEIAARIQEAKIEAEYAQKQLDLQKQLANNQYKAVRITADRNVTDLLAQIALLEQGKQVTVDTANAQRALDILQKKQQRLIENAGTYIEEGAKITTAAMQAATDVQTQTGKAFSYVLTKTEEAWGIFGEQAKKMLQALQGTGETLAQRERRLGEDLNGNGKIGAATGFLGNVSQPTDFTVGEVKGETVAVLRNPRIVPNGSVATAGGSTGGGSAPNITIIISGNTFRDREDIDELIDRVKADIVDEIEERFHRRASLVLR